MHLFKEDSFSIKKPSFLKLCNSDNTEISAIVKKYYPDLTISYSPDFRQAIADSWPGSINDAEARKDWNWNPKFDLAKMVKEMVENI